MGGWTWLSVVCHRAFSFSKSLLNEGSLSFFILFFKYVENGHMVKLSFQKVAVFYMVTRRSYQCAKEAANLSSPQMCLEHYLMFFSLCVCVCVCVCVCDCLFVAVLRASHRLLDFPFS